MINCQLSTAIASPSPTLTIDNCPLTIDNYPMKILLLTPQLPYPAHQGTSLRNLNIVRGLAMRHEISLLSFLEENQSDDHEAIAPLHALCQQIKTIPAPPHTKSGRLRHLFTSRLPDMAHRLYSPAFDVALRRLLDETRYDIVQIEGIELARYMDTVRAASPDSRLIFDNHNAETALQRRNFETDKGNPRRWIAAAYSRAQMGRLSRFERWACAMADGITAVSDTDRAELQQNSPKAAITVIPNCIDVSEYTLDEPNPIPFDLLFSGKMDYRPNVDAVLWFADEVWPRIRAKRPLTTWAIVGQKPHPRLERLRGLDGVTLTGWVDRVQPYLAGATVYVMPFRIGSGTRLKLIEAMASGKPIVSTSMGAEGFPVQSGQELLLAEGVGEMETAVLSLLDDPIARKKLTDNALVFAQQYDWRQVIPLFEEVYRRSSL